MKLTDYITPDHVKIGLEGKTKDDVIEELVELCSEVCDVSDPDAMLQAVLSRERDGSTGLEKGVAIPHAKSDAVGALSIVVGISREGVDFDAQDGKPSHLFFLLVAPTSESGPHVQAIAKIVKLIKIDDFRERMVNAETAEEVVRIIDSAENGEEG